MRLVGRNVRGFGECRRGLLLLVAMLPSFALANATASAEPRACLATAGGALSTVPADWRAVVDADSGWAVRLPPSHDVSPVDDVWYLYETLDGVPLVPDMAVQLHRGQGVEELARELFGDTARLEQVSMGPATLGYQVSIGTDPGAEGYLIAADAGVYAISRYEDFDWDGFDPVACSFHIIELVGGAEATD